MPCLQLPLASHTEQSLKNLLCVFLLPVATVCSDCMTTPSMFVEVEMFVIYFQWVHDSTTCLKGRGVFNAGKGQRRKLITRQACLFFFALQDILGFWLNESVLINTHAHTYIHSTHKDKQTTTTTRPYKFRQIVDWKCSNYINLKSNVHTVGFGSVLIFMKYI